MSQYSVYVVPDEFQDIKKLPGNVRHRIRRSIDDLANNPRPSDSKRLDTEPAKADAIDVWRIRIDSWRIVYLIDEVDKSVDVVAVRK
jgi:mRNA interferase RelE/StbE